MKATFVSTSAITNATREARTDLQVKLAKGQKEATTGRLADVGQTLGYLTERTVSLRQDLDRLNTFKDTNAVASGRLSISQTTLDNVVATAQEFLKSLMAARTSQASGTVAATDAMAKLESFIGSMNTAQNGAYIFAGINTDVKPLQNYDTTPPSTAQTAVAAAFQTEFGMAQGAAGANTITGAQMKTFLDGNFDALFSASSWTTSWSSASDQNISTRINTNERVETGTNANVEAFRNLASAYTMVADLGISSLGSDAYQAVMDKAIAVVGQAVGDITQIRAALGTSEERITSANTSIDAQTKLMKDFITQLESVDPYEATANVNALLTQIETAYSLTARLQNLSLIKFM